MLLFAAVLRSEHSLLQYRNPWPAQQQQVRRFAETSVLMFYLLILSCVIVPMQATFAKMTRAQVEYQRSEVDPTNLYFTNLHKDIDESQVL